MRLRPLAAFLVILALVPLAAFAGAKTPVPSPAVTQTADAQNGGVVEGKVTNVDYQRGVVDVDTQHGAVEVSVMPSTSVQSSEPGYHALTDVTRGSRVQIFTSKISGRLIAQIIKLVKH